MKPLPRFLCCPSGIQQLPESADRTFPWMCCTSPAPWAAPAQNPTPPEVPAAGSALQSHTVPAQGISCELQGLWKWLGLGSNPIKAHTTLNTTGKAIWSITNSRVPEHITAETIPQQGLKQPLNFQPVPVSTSPGVSFGSAGLHVQCHPGVTADPAWAVPLKDG